VLRGTDVPEQAGRLVDFLISAEFQAEVALNLFVYPANGDVALPEVFTDFAVVPEDPATLDPADIADHRASWIETWTDTVLR
jgi:thiamine transport system substrate-binding protein